MQSKLAFILSINIPIMKKKQVWYDSMKINFIQMENIFQWICKECSESGKD